MQNFISENVEKQISKIEKSKIIIKRTNFCLILLIIFFKLVILSIREFILFSYIMNFFFKIHCFVSRTSLSSKLVVVVSRNQILVSVGSVIFL